MIQYIDVGIIGTGPAGLQAALYTTRRQIKTAIFGMVKNSSLFNATLENLCCVDLAKGHDLLSNTKAKIKGFGGQFTETEVLLIERVNEGFKIVDSKKDEFIFKTILFATGIHYEKLGVPGEKEYLGRGVSTCVECDANFFRNRNVSVVGSQSAAIDGVEFLANIASKVTLITQGEVLSKDDSSFISKLDNVDIIIDKVSEIIGDSMKVTSIKLQTGSEIEVGGVFIELGAKGIIELTQSLMIQLDDQFKHIKINEKCMTNIDGAFAAGDITGLPYQVSTAIGEGGIAGMEMGKFIQALRKK